MASPVPCDPTLISEIRRYGKFDPTGCYQCGSCTVSCELVGDSATFPRKIIRYALLGLRQPLVESLEPWICHDCGDCSLICPRQAEPRISMATMRRFLSAQYDWTRLSSRILKSRTWYAGLLVTTAFLVAGLIVLYHFVYGGAPLAELARTPMGLEHMFPKISYFTLTVALLPLILLLTRAFRMWWLIMHRGNNTPVPFSAYVAEARTYVVQSVTHRLMRKCPERGRWFGHWVLALGTVMMLTIKVVALRWFQTDNIYPVYHPQRWLGYLAATCILFGVGSILTGRLRAEKEIYKETRFEDLVFPVLIALVALSGLAVHIFRYAGFELASHFSYACHVIVATPLLVVEMPFGKWSHMIYRPLALFFQAVQERARRLAPGQEVISHAA